MKQNYLKNSLLPREPSPNFPVNYHYTASSLRVNHNSLPAPSMISSSQHIKQRPRRIFLQEIFQFKAGGFKGIIKKARIRSLLPVLTLDIFPEVFIRKEKTQKIQIIQAEKSLLFKTASQKLFKECISVRKLSSRQSEYL